MTAPLRRVRRLAELPASDAQAAVGEDSILILPIGAIEQHGDHLPLATDALVIHEYAEAVVAELGDELDLWLLPTTPFSTSNEHAWAGGTVWLTPETLLATMRDIGNSLTTLATRRLVLLNGHGGNTAMLDVVCRELRLAHGFHTFLLHAALPPDHGGAGVDEELGQGIHGGVSETSVVMYLRPDLVHLERATANVPTWLTTYPNLRFGGGSSFGWLSDDFGPSGVIGDPTLASAELGKQLFEDGVRHLGAVLREVAVFRFGRPFSGEVRTGVTALDVLDGVDAVPRWASLGPEVLARTWHAVARAADVAGEPVRVELLDTALVLARLDGTVVAFDDVCAHRGAALSLGRVERRIEGSCLTCPYHGWEYETSGQCTRIPALPAGRHVPGAARLTARRCVERGGLVWVCLGEPLDDVPAFPEPGAGWRVIVGEPYEWRCDPTRRLENFLDFAHFAFVHDGVLGRRDEPMVPSHRVVVDGTRMFVHQERREPSSAVKPGGDTPDAFTTVVDYVVHLPLAAVLDQRMPGGQRFVLGIASTPIGDGASRTFWVLARDYDLAGDDAQYIAFQKGVNEQDRPVIESLRPEFVPLDVTAELHVRDVDQVAIAYRRALLDLNDRTRGDHACS